MKDFLENTWKHRAHVVLALPAFLILLFIMYVPMAGLVMAFKSLTTQRNLGKPHGTDWITSNICFQNNLYYNDAKHINVLRNLYSNRYFPQCSSGN